MTTKTSPRTKPGLRPGLSKRLSNGASFLDGLEEEISFARGIEAALMGLEGLNKGQLDGVRHLSTMHVDHLCALLARAGDFLDRTVR